MKKTGNDFDPDKLVDQIYDIALDPSALDTFIEAWNGAGMDAKSARKTIEDIDTFDMTFSTHLKRADTFLKLNEEDNPALDEMLTPFENFAAMIIDQSMRIVVCNAGTSQSFDLYDGDPLSKLNTSTETHDLLSEALNSLFKSKTKPDRLLKLEVGPNRLQTMFQIRRLAETAKDGQPLALIVTTQYHWQPALGQTLEEVFGLTSTEQVVVRALVEGRDAKTIAAERNKSEGTVRSQIKSILAKMNASSQSEIIRLVISLRDVTFGNSERPIEPVISSANPSSDWLESEVWKPFQTLTLPDGRRLDYHDMGPITGAPVLYSHMGYGLVRWSRPMINLAFKHGLRIICPIRAGYGQSSNIDPKEDVLASTSDDTLLLLNHLGIDRLPYLTQGNDLIFAADFAAKNPKIISEIIGICARPSLPGDRHYSGMGKWHRFFLSTAKHAPHLLNFAAKAAVSMARRIGILEMYRQMNISSPADLSILEDENLLPVLRANGEIAINKTTSAAQAYAMEVLKTESDWSEIMFKTREIPTWFMNGLEDPSLDMATIAEYREYFPWIQIDVVKNAGQMLIFQRYEDLIPKVANSASRAKK